MSIKDGSADPPIDDGSGYVITEHDLRFLGITDESLRNWRAGRVPLGLSEISFKALKEGLWNALDRDNVDPLGVDINIKGSSVFFFSGEHKTLPWTRDDIEEQLYIHRGRIPEFKIGEVEDKLRGQWTADKRPMRRPFDSMRVIGIARSGSDIDIELCSDAIAEKCAYIAQRRRPEKFHDVSIDDQYNYIDEKIVREAMPKLIEYQEEISQDLDRDIYCVVFEKGGPPESDVRQAWRIHHHGSMTV
ncbi:hypothetical protein AB0876_27740 [Mycobacterium sp. NPDC049093]